MTSITKHVPTPKFQREKLTKLRKSNKNLKPGDRVYLLDSKWYLRWKLYIKDPEKHEQPGPITNEDISYKDGANVLVKPDLLPDKDYKMISFSEWREFKNWYKGGPPITRNVVSEGDIEMVRVEVYLIGVPIVLSDDNGMPNFKKKETLHCSKLTQVSMMASNAEKLFKLPPRSSRLWVFEDDDIDSARLLTDRSETLDDLLLADNETIMVEKQKDGQFIRNEDGTIKKKGFKLFSFLFGSTKNDSKSTNSNSRSSGVSNTKSLSTKSDPGICGLNNLGNTCFMNSGIQCLSNVPPFKEYFVSNAYKSEINTKNPIGMGGNLATQYGTLIKEMWDGSYKSIAPRSFKKVISKFAPQFSGMNQHDAQELIGFLLDGLHEDLNRVKDKPYVVEEEANGRSDYEFALESWENHLKRNQSVVVDHFHGQLKSTVECPECGKVSVKFDPFMYLSVPLSQERETTIEVILIRDKDPDMPKKYAMMLSKNGTVDTVLDYLAEVAGFTKKSEDDKFPVIVTEVFSSRIQKVLQGERPIRNSALKSSYIAIYEKPKKVKTKKPIKIIHRKEKKFSRYIPYKLFALPFLSFVKPTSTGLELYKQIFKRVQRFMVKPQQKSVEPEEQVIIEVVKKEKSNDEESSIFTLSDSYVSEDDSSDDESSSEDTEAGPIEYAAESYSNEPDTWELIEWEEFLDTMPWTLHHVNSSGTKCALCTKKSCRGCEIIPDDTQISLPDTKTYTIAISWTKEGLKNAYSSKLAYGIELDSSTKKLRRKLQKKKKGNLTLNDCVNLFTMNEQLGESDKWYCSDCEELREAFKKFDIWKLPEVLIVQLKRFVWIGTHTGRKNNDYVQFPMFGLNLDDYLINEDEKGVRYNLIGVVTHGGGLNGGHYTAYCRNVDSKEWYYYNDSSVSRLKSFDSIPEGAYVLFYLKDTNFEYSENELEMLEREKKEDKKDREKKKSSVSKGTKNSTSDLIESSERRSEQSSKKRRKKEKKSSDDSANNEDKSVGKDDQSRGSTKEEKRSEKSERSSRKRRKKESSEDVPKDTEEKEDKSVGKDDQSGGSTKRLKESSEEKRSEKSSRSSKKQKKKESSGDLPVGESKKRLKESSDEKKSEQSERSSRKRRKKESSEDLPKDIEEEEKSDVKGDGSGGSVECTNISEDE
eukprot:TRINITY_DN1177_c0_g1_i1.p1 TRINITY_DN1177_c0_g1~~TRINITY_DN1177_c0_g1_i1.p1  ORF type:complete len:1153 (+),score=294.55 TRINITY_DN1177_c0_g1_i1:62-3520(+)